MNSQTLDEKFEKLSLLLPFAPSDFMDKIINKLLEYQKLDTQEL